MRKILGLILAILLMAQPAWAATIAQDLFTEAVNTDLASHTPDTGTGWTESAATTMTVIATTDKLQLSNTADGTNRWAREGTNVVSTNMDVSGNCQVASGASGRRGGLCGRMTTADFDNEYMAYAEGSSGTQCVINLDKNVGGLVTSLGTYTHTYAGGDDEEVLAIKLEIRTAAKKVYLATVERISSADNSLTTNTYAGVYGMQTVSRVDAYLSEDAPADANPRSRGFIIAEACEWFGKLFHVSPAYALDTRVLVYGECPIVGTGTTEDPFRPEAIPFEMAEGVGSTHKVFKADWVLLHQDGSNAAFKVLAEPAVIARMNPAYLKSKATLSKPARDHLVAKGEGRIDGR